MSKDQSEDVLSKVVDRKNGVYYFPFTGGFGEVLSLFIAKNPKLQLVAMAPLDSGYYGSTTGYFVIFKEK